MDEKNLYTFENPVYKDTYRHTTSHILAQAVKRLYPEVKLAIGPAIADGFYYDFDAPFAFTNEHMEAIEAALAKQYGEPRPYYQTGADWNSEALCKDFLTEAQVKYFSGFTTTADMPDTPITQINLRTDAYFVLYGGEKTNNAVFFASDYSNF